MVEQASSASDSAVLPAWTAPIIDSDRRYPDRDAQMALAIELARRNVEHASGGPFGAALFTDAGELVSVGVNRTAALCASAAHAELIALTLAQRKLGRPRLNADGRRYILAGSGQLCAQCYGALFWAGIDTLLIGARAADNEEAGFYGGPLPADWTGELERHGIAVVRDLRRAEACAVLAEYARRGGVHY